MALPFGPYEGQDLTEYEAGNKFLPRQFYSLGFPNTPPPSIANPASTGITNTQAAGSYMGYPSYEAWLLAQGGGGGNGGGRDDNITNTYNVNQNLGSTNITDYEAEASDVGPTWAGSWAKAKDLYSKLPTPGNLIMKGIRHWKQRREDKIAKDAAIEQARIDKISQQSQANAAAAGGGGAQSGITASTTAAQAAGMGGGSRQATSAGSTKSGRTDGGWGWAQGGRIGFKDGLSAYQLFKLKELGYGNAASNPGSYGGLGVLRDILKLHKYKDGGRIGYRNGEFVEDINVEGPGFDVNENMEMAEGPSPFELRVQELVDTGMSWQEAYTIAEEEFGLTAEGPEESFSEEGIASIV